MVCIRRHGWPKKVYTYRSTEYLQEFLDENKHVTLCGFGSGNTNSSQYHKEIKLSFFLVLKYFKAKSVC